MILRIREMRSNGPLGDAFAHIYVGETPGELNLTGTLAMTTAQWDGFKDLITGSGAGSGWTVEFESVTEGGIAS